MSIKVSGVLEKVRKEKPVVHHLTNWVTIYDCANIVKVFGASPVMAHAQEEAGDMVKLASALVLNIGTLTVDFVHSMKVAAKGANMKGIPVVLDVCGAGATKLRDDKSLELLDVAKVDIIKGNASEVARIAGENVYTKGVDAAKVNKDLVYVAKSLAAKRACTVVITGKEDIVTDGSRVFTVKNGHDIMGCVVGTGCMAASVIGTFAAVERDLVLAAACGLACFEAASEIAAASSGGPGTFKGKMYDAVFNLDGETADKMSKIAVSE
ncbi:MAG: hydroxyethylthiazole kinase [Endomicrobiales bacterium]|nr:hydroxyethylthiazole kinase [Endomicrobiales bacterium]